MNVRSVIEEIHARIERESSAGSPADRHHASLTDDDLNSLRLACEHLYRTRNLVGQMPPSPDTVRARVGGHLIRLVQRMLFWYTPQILQFHNETTSALSSTCKLIERQAELISELQGEVQALRRRIPAMVAMPAATTAGTTAGCLPPAFEFALQDHFRGTESETRTKLQIWMDTITSPAESRRLPEGPWLDVGCGRGEWLSIVARAGHRAIGIDSNPASVEHCRSRELHAEQAEVLDWLEKVPDESLAVITAFHVVEHLPADRLLAFVSLAARKLQRGGILAVETPDPANLLMGSNRFWNDPTHQRPLPSALLEFIFGFFGLSVARRLELNPSPPEEHLPYTEIELIRRVDKHLYGPQDYGIIGRRDS